MRGHLLGEGLGLAIVVAFEIEVVALILAVAAFAAGWLAGLGALGLAITNPWTRLLLSA